MPSSEDCLYLNVITPAVSPDEKSPVALWIYGDGGSRSSNYLLVSLKLTKRTLKTFCRLLFCSIVSRSLYIS